MRRLHIHQKLSLIVAMLSLPIALYAAMYLRESVDAANRFDDAASGLDAIEQLSSLAYAASMKRPSSSSSVWGDATPAFVDAAADEALGGFLAKARDGSPAQRTAAAGGAIGLVARLSSLPSATPAGAHALTTLASDGAPLLLLRVRRFADVAERLAKKEALNPADRMSFLVTAGQFKGVADSISKAMRPFAEADATTAEATRAEATPQAAALAEATQAYRKANAALQRTGVALANTVNTAAAGADLPQAAFDAASNDLLTATHALSLAAVDTLRARVVQRSADAWFAVAVAGGGALAVLIGALLAAMAMRRSILAAIGSLSNGIRALADDQIDGDVPGAERSDELSEVARAVAYFRDRTVEATAGALSARREAEETARAEMMSVLERAFGDVVSAAIDGDLSRRVPATFDDAALNRLADQVNDLVAAFEHGLRETSDVMARLARADLSARMTKQTGGAFLSLQNDVNTVVDALSEIVGRLRTASADLKCAGSAIAGSSTVLVDRMSDQRSAAAATSETISSMVASMLECASTAETARTTVGGARAAMQGGRSAMEDANADMERIRSAATEISDIITLIESVTMQTNMLATNASVEASRAGASGKGFAVVAEEVRALAQSTARASDDVKRLVTTTLNEIENGAARVLAASEKLGEVDRSITESADAMENIAGRSTQQANELEALSEAAKQMDVMADDCSRRAEQTRVQIQRTEAQTQMLDDVVAGFSMGDAPSEAMDRHAA